jgi:hypothetical protein
LSEFFVTDVVVVVVVVVAAIVAFSLYISISVFLFIPCTGEILSQLESATQQSENYEF